MSLSINTNASAKIAIETLNATQSSLSSTENEVSTGLAVSTAADNAASFGIAQQMQGNVSGQSAVNDGLSFAAQTVSSTTSAANQILSVLQSVQSAVTSLGNNLGNTDELDQIGTQITQYLAQIDTIARNATYSGVNLLAAGTADGKGMTTSSLNYVTGLQGDISTVTGFAGTELSGWVTNAGGTASATGTTLTAILGLSTGDVAGANPTGNVFETIGSGITSAYSGTSGVASMISQVQAAIKAMTFVTSSLGANTNMISNMSTYGSTISDNLTNGIGALTDADMSAASAKLTSLQTKQSLAIKSLTIANAQSQNILSLFQ